MNTKGFFPGVFMKYGFGVLVILHLKGTVNFLNIRTPKTFVVITLKFELCGSTIE